MKKSKKIPYVVALINSFLFFSIFLILLISAISLSNSGNEARNSISASSLVAPCIIFCVFSILFFVVFVTTRVENKESEECAFKKALWAKFASLIAIIVLNFVLFALAIVDYLSTKRFCSEPSTFMLYLGCITMVTSYPLNEILSALLNNKSKRTVNVIRSIVLLLPSVLLFATALIYLTFDISNTTKVFLAVVFILAFALNVVSTVALLICPSKLKLLFAVNVTKIVFVFVCSLYMLIDSVVINSMFFGISDFVIYFPLMVLILTMVLSDCAQNVELN